MFQLGAPNISILFQFFICLGAFVFIRICYHIFLEIYNAFIFFYDIRKTLDLKSYGEWAVVTGCTDGIGKAFAEELAEKGMNIVLISRSEEKLRNTAAEIEKEHSVKTLCIQADFKNRDCYSNIKKNLQDIDIAILVNNVGMTAPKPKKYYNVDENHIWNEIDVNIGSVVMMTRIVLPHMVEKHKGIILNLSSLTTKCCLPLMCTYSATKSFIEMFSYSISPELKKHNIIVRCLIPGFVVSAMTKKYQKYTNTFNKLWLFPHSKTYVRNAMDSLSGKQITTTGYWPFTLPLKLLSSFSWEKKGQFVYSLMTEGYKRS